MPISKVRITEEFAKDLRALRLNHPVNGQVLTAQGLSFAINKPRVWMSQLESPNKKGKKFVRTTDLNLIFEKLLGKDAYKSDEYMDFMARHANNIPTDHTLWQRHKAFSINPRLSGAVDYEKAVHSSLKELSESFKQLIDAAHNDEKRFIVLRSINMLNKNLQRVPDQAVILNTIPLFICEDSAAFSYNVTKSMLLLIDECAEHIRKEPEAYDICSMPWAKDAIVAALLHVEDAIAVLKTMIGAEAAIEELKKTYNEHLRQIDLICKSLFFSESIIAPIADDACGDMTLICDHLKVMDSLNKRFTVLLEKIRAEYETYEEHHISQIQQENSAEYQQEWGTSLSSEHWENLKIRDED